VQLLPDLSVIWVIFFVLLLTFLLNRLLFRPLVRVMDARQAAAKAARDLADQAASDAKNATAEFDARTRVARQEIARQMEETRRAAEAERVALVAAAHQQTEITLAGAAAQLSGEVADARQRIERESGELAQLIANRVLGRQTT
jgi:F-type H+-transporting ATPase subunit b